MSLVRVYRISTLPGRITRDSVEVVEWSDYQLVKEERDRLAAELEALKAERASFGREVEQAAHTVIDALEAELSAARADAERREDLAYYYGAREAAAMAHQSLTAMDEWINGGCGGRYPIARTASSAPVSLPEGK